MLINQKNPHGGDIYSNRVNYDFSSNLNPSGMPDEVKNAITESVAFCGVYPDARCSKLRSAISEAENVPFENIICGNGAAELIYSFAYSLNKEKPALIVSPTFSEYETALRAAKTDIKHLILSEKNGFTLTEDMLPCDLRSYSAVFICSPNNPTGKTVDLNVIRKICSFGVRIFADFCFLDLSDDPKKYSVPDLLAEYPDLTVLKAFTKNYSMAGIRLGYAMSSDEQFLDKMSEKTQCWNVSAIAQHAGCAALGCKKWLEDTASSIREERERVAGILASEGIRVFPSEANFLLLYSKKDLKSLLIKRGILIRDCSDYIGLKKGYFRIAIKKKEENDILISALKEVIR
ncbi:MAG: aminotransferase class I/II-fold pyridoxal phosphate-dependent enzyme [Clostridia bacterium]|nr:aminotransferase class I/II-fold pyridoxal phosphate-dependent enzyme [Clostridia bacterium]